MYSCKCLGDIERTGVEPTFLAFFEPCRGISIRLYRLSSLTVLDRPTP
jgi:hypothetical protein